MRAKMAIGFFYSWVNYTARDPVQGCKQVRNRLGGSEKFSGKG